MQKIVLAAAIAAAAFTAAPLAGVVTPAKAQVDVRVGDRDRDWDRDHHRGPGFSIGLGERRHHCRTVITKIERYGREIVKRERRCD